MIRSTVSKGMGTDNIPKLVMSFFITTLAGMILSTLYNLTDTLFVSWGVGDNATGGVAVVFPFVVIQGAISSMLGGGAAAIVSKLLGEGRREDAGKTTFNAFVIFYSVAFIMTVVGLVFMKPLLRVMGAMGEMEIYSYAEDYFTIILIGNVFSTGFSSVIRAEGRKTYAMLIWIIPISVNIIADAVFIFVLKAGVKGSAYATVLSQFISFVMSVIFFTRMSEQSFKVKRLDARTVLDILKIGFPALLQMAGFSVITFAINRKLAVAGAENDIVAFGYVTKILYYSMSPILALSQAIMPIIGYNFGLKRNDRVREVVRFTLIIAYVYVLGAVIFEEIIPRYLIMMFTDNIVIVDSGAYGLRIVLSSLLFMPVPLIYCNKLQALGRSSQAVTIYGLCLIAMIIPLILPLSLYDGQHFWWIYTAAYLVAFMLSAVAIKIMSYRTKNRDEGQLI